MLVARRDDQNTAEEGLADYFNAAKEPGDKPVMLANFSDILASVHSNASQGFSYFLHPHSNVRAHQDLVRAMKPLMAGAWAQDRSERGFFWGAPGEDAGSALYPLFDG